MAAHRGMKAGISPEGKQAEANGQRPLVQRRDVRNETRPALTACEHRHSVGDIGEEKLMSKLHLTFACGPYDRTLALRDGSVQPEGIDLNYIASQPPDIFWRMLQFKEFEISEMSLSNHATLVSTGDAPFVAIPVFPSRVF